MTVTTGSEVATVSITITRQPTTSSAQPGGAATVCTTFTEPLLEKTWDARRPGLSVALDGAGKPAVLYWLNPAEGYNMTLAFWLPRRKECRQSDRLRRFPVRLHRRAACDQGQ